MGAGTSPRQRALAKIWIMNEINKTGMSFTEMARAAGFAETTATNEGKRTLVKEGTQRAIREIQKSMKDALEEKGIGPEYLAAKLELMLEGKFEKDVNFRAVNYGLEHALKIGIGGGYKPIETKNVNLNVSPEDLKKFTPLKNEFEERMREEELNGSDE